MPGHELHARLRRVEAERGLDRAASRTAGAVASALRRTGTKDLLTGTWLGHALHPVLTDFADGAWMGASFLDLFGPGDNRAASRRLIGFGLLAAVPTALSGLAEWTDTAKAERRVGVLHAATSTAAMALYGVSYLARRGGRHRAGVVLGVVGGFVAIADGYVGGHLSLALGVGVAHTTFDRLPREWTEVAAFDDLPDGSPAAVVAAGTPIVLVRRGAQVFALSDRCTYRGAELHRGRVDVAAIVCPGHGCTYRLQDGAVLRGPASIPQPCLDTRVIEGRVDVRDRRAADILTSGGP